MVGQPGQHGGTVEWRVVLRGPFRGPGVHEVVHAVAVRPRGLDEVRGGQLGQRRARRHGAGVEQRGERGRVEAGPGMQPQRPERGAGQLAQVAHGPGEHRPDRGPRVAAGLEQVQQPLLVGELRGQVAQRRRGLRDGSLGGDPQGERQPGAAVHQRARRCRIGIDPVLADQRAEQVQRVRFGQHVQVDPLRSVPGHEPGQEVPAGHQDEARRLAGQQRADLFGVARVVEQHEHAPAGEQRPVQRGPLGQVGGDVGAGYAERAQEAAQRDVRRQRRVRVEPAQVDPQLPVREVAGDPVRPVHRERGLADPAPAGERGDHHRGAGRAQLVEPVELAAPAAEPRDVRRQLARHRPGPAASRGRGGGLGAPGGVLAGGDAKPRRAPVPLLGRARAQRDDDPVQDVRRGQVLAGHVGVHGRARFGHPAGQLGQGDAGLVRAARRPGAQQAQLLGEVGDGVHAGGVRAGGVSGHPDSSRATVQVRPDVSTSGPPGLAIWCTRPHRARARHEGDSPSGSARWVRPVGRRDHR